MARSLLVAARNWTRYPPEHPAVEEPRLANTWDRDSRGEYPYAVVEAIDPEPVAIDPLKYL